MEIIYIYAALMLTASIIAMILYKADKVKAEKKKWRISERTLLLSGFFFGAAGALLGMKLFRHKTKHWYFWIWNIINIAWQIALFAYIITRVLSDK